MKTSTKFIFILSVVALIGFGIHLLVHKVIQIPLFSHRLVLAYVGNWFLASVILIALLKAPKKFQNSLGFLFMMGSILKFGFFFLCFYGSYLSDGDISRSEFFAFFTPYALCLITETKLLINKLSEE